VLALHTKGCDARSRGRAGRAFQAHCAALGTSLANVIMLNFWIHDIGRLDATRCVLLETVFPEAVRAAVRRQQRWRRWQIQWRNNLLS
jgi:hypothetical protein